MSLQTLRKRFDRWRGADVPRTKCKVVKNLFCRRDSIRLAEIFDLSDTETILLTDKDTGKEFIIMSWRHFLQASCDETNAVRERAKTDPRELDIVERLIEDAGYAFRRT